jgi:Flp pilus assembly pilin Flp
MLKRLWLDESGTLLSSEYLILGTLLTLGLIVGISAARNAIYSELEDYAAALEGLQAGEVGPAGTTFVGTEGGIAP